MSKLRKYLVPIVIVAVLGVGIPVAVVAMTSGCTSKNDNAKALIKKLYYFKDARTGLCFAVSNLSASGYMAHVPCDKVKKYLVNK